MSDLSHSQYQTEAANLLYGGKNQNLLQRW